MKTQKDDDSNVYAAFLEGKVSKQERKNVLNLMMQNPRLILELNLASAITETKGKSKNKTKSNIRC